MRLMRCGACGSHAIVKKIIIRSDDDSFEMTYGPLCARCTEKLIGAPLLEEELRVQAAKENARESK